MGATQHPHLVIGSIRARVDRWFLSRRAPSDAVVLTQRNVYILPTAAGWLLFATLLVLLVASINFQLNLGYLLTFLLAGCVVVGMHVGHGTLRGLQLHLLAPEPQFAGAAAVARVVLHNARRSARYGIGLSIRGSGHWTWADVPPGGNETVEIAFSPPQRGWQNVPALSAETRFPLGTFRVWTVWQPAARVLVWPSPESRPPPLPSGQDSGDAEREQRAASQQAGEYDGVRAYRRGDPRKLIVWKLAARAQATGSNALVSRDTQESQHRELWLDEQQAALPEAEARLSRLCAWVLMAERAGLDYGLQVAGQRVPPSQGDAHRMRCLEVLATC